mmetsp:Transcript_13969/g.33247  ORF Transcript_13969/g.33247 Transcript_13969/m.33247 type:complete len:227 (+) Transcript_13969:570-1250(+)
MGTRAGVRVIPMSSCPVCEGRRRESPTPPPSNTQHTLTHPPTHPLSCISHAPSTGPGRHPSASAVLAGGWPWSVCLSTRMPPLSHGTRCRRPTPSAAWPAGPHTPPRPSPRRDPPFSRLPRVPGAPRRAVSCGPGRRCTLDARLCGRWYTSAQASLPLACPQLLAPASAAACRTRRRDPSSLLKKQQRQQQRRRRWNPVAAAAVVVVVAWGPPCRRCTADGAERQH